MVLVGGTPPFGYVVNEEGRFEADSEKEIDLRLSFVGKRPNIAIVGYHRLKVGVRDNPVEKACSK